MATDRGDICETFSLSHAETQNVSTNKSKFDGDENDICEDHSLPSSNVAGSFFFKCLRCIFWPSYFFLDEGPADKKETLSLFKGKNVLITASDNDCDHGASSSDNYDPENESDSSSSSSSCSTCSSSSSSSKDSNQESSKLKKY